MNAAPGSKLRLSYFYFYTGKLQNKNPPAVTEGFFIM